MAIIYLTIKRYKNRVLHWSCPKPIGIFSCQHENFGFDNILRIIVFDIIKNKESCGDLFEHYLSLVRSARYTLENQIQIEQSVMNNRRLISHRLQLDYCIFYQDICLTYFRNSTFVISSIPSSLKF